MKDYVVTRIEEEMVRCYGHGERMNISRLTSQIYRVNLDGGVGRSRPPRIYILIRLRCPYKDQVNSIKNKRVCTKRLMRVEEAIDVCRERSKWRSMVSAYPNERQV